MGEALVGAMVAAMRRVNRDRADAVRSAPAERPARSEGAAWGCLVHPSLMPTVYSPIDDACAGVEAVEGPAASCERRAPRDVGGSPSSGEDVAARKV